MKEFKAIEHADAYGIYLATARRLTEEEKTSCQEWYRNLGMVGTGTYIHMPNITTDDLPDRPRDGMFYGCANRVWIISDDEWDLYTKLDAQRAEAKAEKARLDRIDYLRGLKSRIEARGNIPSRAEAERQMEAWNNTQNEGGWGYVPHIYSIDEYNSICAELNRLTRQED